MIQQLYVVARRREEQVKLLLIESSEWKVTQINKKKFEKETKNHFHMNQTNRVKF